MTSDPKLRDILDNLATKIHNLSPGDVGSFDRVLVPINQAEAAIITYMQEKLLELVGPDEEVTPHTGSYAHWESRACNDLRADLRSKIKDLGNG